MPDIDVQRLLVRLEARIDKYEQTLAKANQTTDKRARAIEARFDQSVRKLDEAGREMGRVYDPLLAAARRTEAQLAGSSGRIKTALLSTSSSLATSFAAGFTVNKVKEYADGYTRFTNELKIAGREGDQLANVQERLYASAQKYGAPLEKLGTLYGKTAQVQKDLGASNEDLLRFTNGTAAALKVQGGTAESANGALLQLTQGLGSTIFRAEEFNSVMEGARPILQAVAAGSDRWGGSVSKLRNDVIAGNVTNKDFFQAALVGFAQTEKQAEKATLTIGASLQILNNALGKYIGETDASLSATQRLSAGIQGIANNLDVIAPALATIGAAYGTKLVVGAVQARKAEIELALAVAQGSAEYIEGVRAAELKARAAVAGSRAEVAGIEATIAALRSEAAQYQANIALANEQRAAARAASAQAAANSAAGFGGVRVGAGDLSGAVTRGGAQAAEAQAGKAALATRRELSRVTSELEVAEAALVTATARASAAEVTHVAAMKATTLGARAAAAATELFTGALTLIGGSAVGGAVVLTVAAIVGAIILHNRHVKQAAADQRTLAENTKTLNETLKQTGEYGRSAAAGVKGLGAQASESAPKVTAFAGAVGKLADELYRAAEARRAEAIASVEAQKSKAQLDLNKALARQEEEQRPVRNSTLEEGGRGAAGAAASVGLNQSAALNNGTAAYEVGQARANLKASDAELARLKGLKLEGFVRPSDLTGKRDLPKELSDLQQQLRVAQAAHNSGAIRELNAQIYTIKQTSKYMKQGLSYEVALATASKEAADIKAAGDGAAAAKESKATAREAAKADRQDLQHDRRYSADLARAKDDQLEAEADLTSSTQARLAVELSRIETARKAREEELADQAKSAANPSGYSPDEIKELTRLANETADKRKKHAQAVADQEQADQNLALAQAEADGRIELLQAQVALATTVAERRDLDLRILEIQQEEEKARLEAVVASKTASEADKALARQKLSILPTLNATQRRIVERDNETQLAAYQRSLAPPRSEVLDGAAVDGLQALRSSLLDAARSSEKFGEVITNTIHAVEERVLGDLIDKAIIAPASRAAGQLVDSLTGAATVTADTASATAAGTKAAADTAAAGSVAAMAAATTAATSSLLALSAAATAAAGAQGTGTAFAFLGLKGGGSIPGYAGGGGLVRGPGGPTDDAILAQMASGRFLRLSNEEFVVKASATRKNRALLEMINSGRVRGYANGGSLAIGSSLTAVRRANSVSAIALSAGGRNAAVQMFDLRGAVVTEELLRDINGRISASETRATANGARGGAVLSTMDLNSRSSRRLGR